ncbi:Outer membrane cobalamin receptor protein [uncultured Sphingopyxis sp.]|uniref:Outer membrane cobalamin receptor protein n=1 Tax=uncultured Sphingopyxis sp. TaxID=310581 RepID=A0A1Y5PTQ5_9SPHN|nr:TonB-dependent receptor [uncultured Sphingopyxis sp.]SBV33382.1 Outer membrane cobalamin receptor protein [uncultured Sphingopyxis sp.]
MRVRACNLRKFLLSGAAVGCLLLSGNTALAREHVTNYRIPAQSLDRALRDFGVQSGVTLLVDAAIVNGKRTAGHSKRSDPETALRALLLGTGLSYRRDGDVFVVTREGNVTPLAAGGEIEDPTEIVVTAQKREEKISDVPIAISAFTPKALDDRKVESGAELVRAVPNINFSKGNFSSYDFTIRGIGTKAISASSDPAVAVSFNNTPLIRNRLFEAEFFDLERVEVLRGPQGTLYGRNATGGVVNVIPAMPSDEFEGMAKGEVGNFATRRLSGMINVPLTDTLAVRAAGAMTKRDGFDYNTFTQKRVNDRDLWSTRVSAQWEPTDDLKASFIWQHFEEDDQRSRTGKQLCTRDDGPAMLGTTVVPDYLRAKLSQGCKPGSLYSDAAFGAPNASSFAFVYTAKLIGIGNLPDPVLGVVNVPLIDSDRDPYAGIQQSRDLREIATSYDPVFRAKNDVFQLNVEAGVGDLKLISQTAYSRDRYYSSQDYNRFVSVPIFNDSADPRLIDGLGRPNNIPGPTPGGVYTDPQLGPSDRMLAVDVSQSRNTQWTQELRLQSDFSGPFNFSVGANALNFKSQDDYYVFSNLFSALAEYFYNREDAPGEIGTGTRNCDPGNEFRECIYVDPNPIDQIDGQGHNYFRSKNVVQTRSWALFGEAYWNVSDDVKITAGARYTNDKKTSTPIPSQLLLGAQNFGNESGPSSGGRVSIGYPALPPIDQQWDAFTGRLVVDWKPETSFSDDTLVYASFSHGYKGGGSNPPRVDIDPKVIQYQPLAETFKPEYVNAFEIGTKNSFAGGRMTLNATAFFYDYTDYQVSQIVDRISLNENFDAQSWGLELEAAWRPSRNFRVDSNFGYLRTRIGKGAQSIDVMNRTQGNEDWVVVRPQLGVPSNCIAPRDKVEAILNSFFAGPGGLGDLMLSALCAGSARYGSFNPNVETNLRYDQFLGFTYDPLTDAPNGGRGFYADLEGNELPNSPRFTFNIGAQYTFFIDDWNLTFRGDYYRQAKSYARVYNTEYDRLRAWDNANLAVTLERPESQFAMQLYVKNLFNDTPITNTFTNSDDTGLSANIFTLDPRIIGFSVTKRF